MISLKICERISPTVFTTSFYVAAKLFKANSAKDFMKNLGQFLIVIYITVLRDLMIKAKLKIWIRMYS